MWLRCSQNCPMSGRDQGPHSLGIQYSTTGCGIRGRRYCGDDGCGRWGPHDAGPDLWIGRDARRRCRHGLNFCRHNEIDRRLRASSRGKYRLARHAAACIRKYSGDDGLNSPTETFFIARRLECSGLTSPWMRVVANRISCCESESYCCGFRTRVTTVGARGVRLDHIVGCGPRGTGHAVLGRGGCAGSCRAHDLPACDGVEANRRYESGACITTGTYSRRRALDAGNGRFRIADCITDRVNPRNLSGQLPCGSCSRTPVTPIAGHCPRSCRIVVHPLTL